MTLTLPDAPLAPMRAHQLRDDSQVGELHAALRSEQHVGRLNVAVDGLALHVHVVERREHARADARDARLGEGPRLVRGPGSGPREWAKGVGEGNVPREWAKGGTNGGAKEVRACACASVRRNA